MLNVPALTTAIKAAFQASIPAPTPAQTAQLDALASALANAMHAFVLSAQVNYTAGLVVGSTPVTGVSGMTLS